MKPSGYIVVHPEPFVAEHGAFYDYLLAYNGVLVEAENAFIKARIPIAPTFVRGLVPVDPLVELKHGKIPARLFELAFSVMLASPRREIYVAVIWDGDQYSLRIPEQQGGVAGVEFQMVDSAVLDLHSHPDMAARFSSIDDKDEQGFRVYGVIGRGPELRLRIGIYGYYFDISPDMVFDRLPDMLLPNEFKGGERDLPAEED